LHARYSCPISEARIIYNDINIAIIFDKNSKNAQNDLATG